MKVQLSIWPDAVLDLGDNEIADLKAQGFGVTEVTDAQDKKTTKQAADTDTAAKTEDKKDK